MKWKLLFLILCCLVSFRATAQTPATPLVRGTIDESNLVTLHGTVSPLVRTGVDLGAVSNSFAAERLILLLNRPPEREAALQQFLQNAHTHGSASYHKWLTPAQFGAQFGPADSDMQTATGWLGSHGFQVVTTSQSRQFIEFAGTAGQLHEAFHTTIHQYNVAGETHYANASEVEIPAALAPLVRGLAPLNDFRAKPYVKVAGTATYSRSTGKATPQWTTPNPYGTANPYAYPVTPEDFATQYDLAPLYKAGTNGTGETIGIINESNIDLSLVQDYQSLFGVAGSPPQVVIDGDDPGDLPDVDVEAYLDVELSGALAPKATVDLYISSGGDLVDPLELAALRAVEDNQASVLSVSFGNCEYTLESAGNQFWSALWEQAAAQGQTVFVSAGDSGPQCANQTGWVSGLASTPWDIAMGGTDFYYSDYASGGASMVTLWNTTNDANLGSLKAPLPEQPWGDPFGLNVIPNSIERNEFDAGGGGASNCIAVNSTTGACSGGYAKPSWQSGPGVPADKVRDLPDISLFASNGANLSAYAICSYEGECAPGSGDNAGVDLAGGTSASAPAMAGIMALIDQKYGRQGQANFTFYPLAQQKPAAFHDIIVGNNSQVCGPTLGPDCALQPNGYDGTPQYPAGPGYDQASGLGSVDAAALVNNWNSITFQPTATTLHLSTSSVAHGTPVTITTSVAASSGSGTPTGDVAILTNSTLPASASQTFLSLTNGAGSGSVDYLPGGDYQVTGRYGGDGMFASSTSSPETLKVTPENSDINFLVTSGPTAIATGGTIQYNAPLVLSVQPIGVSAAGTGKPDGNATGSAKFTIDSTTATVALNGAGMANWNPPALAIGTHTASANYLGDASFNASSAMPVTFSVGKGNAALNMNIIAPESMTAPVYNIIPGGSLTLVAQVGPGNGILTGVPSPPGTVAPTGTVTVCLGPNYYVCQNPTYSQTIALVSPSGAYSLYSSATVTFPNLAAGYYVPTFTYSGDANWQAGGLQYLTTIFVAPITSMTATKTALSISPANISGTQGTQFTTTVAGAAGSTIAPTGIVSYYDNGNFLVYDFITPASTGATSSATFSLNAASFWNSGANQITAIYSGDTHYAPSTSNVATVTAIQTQVGNFALAPQLSQVTVQAGSSGSVGINLSPIYGFSGAVALTCMPSSSQFSCSVNPTTVTVNGQATAMLTVTAAVQSARNAPPGQRNSDGPEAAGMLVFGFLLACGKAHRKLRRSVLLSLCLVAAMLTVSCGGGGATGKTAPPPPPPGSTPAGTYSVLVTGAANGIVHNAKITVVVP